MNRPYTICYLNVSAEAHIDGDFGKLEEAKAATAVFRRRWLEMEADATIYGAATMALFTKGRLTEPLPPPKLLFPARIGYPPLRHPNTMWP